MGALWLGQGGQTGEQGWKLGAQRGLVQASEDGGWTGWRQRREKWAHLECAPLFHP